MTQTQLQIALELLGVFLSGSLTYLLLEAAKYGKEFDLRIFWTSNIKPFLYTLVGGVSVIAAVAFIPQIIPIIEAQTGEDLELSYTGILLAGTVVGGIIKSYISNNRKKSLNQ